MSAARAGRPDHPGGARRRGGGLLGAFRRADRAGRRAGGVAAARLRRSRPGTLLRLGDKAAAKSGCCRGIASGELIATLALRAASAGRDGRPNGGRGHPDRLGVPGAQRGRRRACCSFPAEGAATEPGRRIGWTPPRLGSPGRRCPRWTTAGRWPGSRWTARRARALAATRPRRSASRRRTWRNLAIASESARRRWRACMRDDQRVRQDPGRLRPADRRVPGRSSTGWPSWTHLGARRTPRCATPPERPTSDPAGFPRVARWPGSRCRPATSTPPSPPSSCTAASASPGSTTRTCTRRTPSRSTALFGGPGEQLDRLADALGI